MRVTNSHAQSEGSSAPCANFFAIREKDNSEVLGEDSTGGTAGEPSRFSDENTAVIKRKAPT